MFEESLTLGFDFEWKIHKLFFFLRCILHFKLFQWKHTYNSRIDIHMLVFRIKGVLAFTSLFVCLNSAHMLRDDSTVRHGNPRCSSNDNWATSIFAYGIDGNTISIITGSRRWKIYVWSGFTSDCEHFMFILEIWISLAHEKCCLFVCMCWTLNDVCIAQAVGRMDLKQLFQFK